jgi:MBG domain-containing protein
VNQTFDGRAKLASATTNPAGLSGLTLTYSMAGLSVTEPIDAGTYLVLATLENPNYEAPQATGILTIGQATPAIHWATPAPISAGTALGDAQLNATATGIGGVTLTGEFVYLPPRTTVLTVGTRPLSVEFIPHSGNYTRAISGVTIIVTEAASSLRFGGFFRPVHNLPATNRMTAGRAVPVKFTVEGSAGLSALQVGSPTSIPASCSAAGSEEEIEETVDADGSSLRAMGQWYTYTWKTSSAWAGTCRRLVVTLVDGTRHEALFHFVNDVKRGSEERAEVRHKKDKRDKVEKRDRREDDDHGDSRGQHDSRGNDNSGNDRHASGKNNDSRGRK